MDALPRPPARPPACSPALKSGRLVERCDTAPHRHTSYIAHLPRPPACSALQDLWWNPTVEEVRPPKIFHLCPWLLGLLPAGPLAPSALCPRCWRSLADGLRRALIPPDREMGVCCPPPRFAAERLRTACHQHF